MDTHRPGLLIADHLPRDALHGLPANTIRFLSNLCREIYEIGLRADRAQRTAEEAAGHTTDLWSGIQSNLLQMKTAIDGEMGQVRNQIEIVIDDQRLIRSRLDQIRAQTDQQAVNQRGLGDRLDQIEARHQSGRESVSAVRRSLSEISDRLQSSWSTIHHHHDRINTIDLQSKTMIKETKQYVDDRYNQLDEQIQSESSTIQHQMADHHQTLQHAIDLLRQDTDRLRASTQEQMQNMIESALELDKTRRQDEIRLLLDSTHRLTQQQQQSRTGPGTDPIMVQIMTVVNANAALFAERHEQTLERYDQIAKLVRRTQSKMHELEDRLATHLHELYQTLSTECEHRLHDHYQKTNNNLISAHTTTITTTAPALHRIQTQIDRLQERSSNETRHLRRSMEAVCDTVAKFSTETDTRLRACELRHVVHDLDSRVKRIDPGPSPRARALILKQQQRCVSQSRSSSRRYHHHIPDHNLLTAEGVTIPIRTGTVHVSDSDSERNVRLHGGELDQILSEQDRDAQTDTVSETRSPVPLITQESIRLAVLLRKHAAPAAQQQRPRSSNTAASAPRTTSPAASVPVIMSGSSQLPRPVSTDETLSGW